MGVITDRMNNQAIRNESNKKVRKTKYFKSIFNKENMSERNRIKMEELERLDAAKREQSTMQFKRIFSKKRIITYLCLMFLAPYGIYRVWYKDSTFNKVEKYLWTFIFIMLISKLVNLIL
ncbi:hypothetical protein [Sporosalibacterium faouarense]|uniref:hypothetical protein n=1 Tax=Sporosalibacterium faouarense TaxID=516123 RepID=UPI00192B3803|nr:hypothetical protein [Sporosalibacterium faouarense]